VLRSQYSSSVVRATSVRPLQPIRRMYERYVWLPARGVVERD
jgi:hypothetical protein